MRKIEKGELVGKVDRYYRKISVAALKLSCCLNIGDTIRIVGGRGTDFKQKVESMETDHKKIQTAEAGASIGIKVKEPVREGYSVYKL